MIARLYLDRDKETRGLVETKIEGTAARGHGCERDDAILIGQTRNDFWNMTFMATGLESTRSL